MKYLTFIRHAKSDWSNHGQDDFDRVLNGRGKRVAPKMGSKLQELKFHPNKIYSSTAVRARLTSELLVEQLDYPVSEVNYVDDIYEASTRSLLNFINNLNDQFYDVAIIGHNPSLTYLCEYLTGEVIGNVPTTGIVRVRFDFDEWKMISEKTAELIYFIFPKKFDF